MLKKLFAIVLGAIALAVALHFMFTPFYADIVDIDRVWYVLDCFMALAVLVVLAVHYFRKRTLGERGPDESITREYLEVNLAFYASIVLAIWFFWNWFDYLTVDADSQGQINLLMWTFVDPLFVLVSGITGFRLWRDASRE